MLEQLFKQYQGSVLGIFDLFSGGNLPSSDDFRSRHHAVHHVVDHFAVADVVVWPYLERLQKEGELGRRKITQYTRYLTIILSAFQSFSIARTLESQTMSGSVAGLSSGPAASC